MREIHLVLENGEFHAGLGCPLGACIGKKDVCPVLFPETDSKTDEALFFCDKIPCLSGCED